MIKYKEELTEELSGEIFMNSYMIALLIWNIVVMLIYGIDKMLAIKGKRWISEKTLISCAFSLGGCGAVFGMILFNHKTSKMKFRILIPLFAVVNVLVFRYLCDLFNIIVN